MKKIDQVGDAKQSLLLKIQENLDERASAVIAEVVDAVCREARYGHPDTSGLVTEAFARSILTRLQVHHATAGEKFRKTPFEYAFERANRDEGRQVSDTAAGNPTLSGWDVMVDGVRFSLKTQAEKSLSTKSAMRTGESRAAVKVSKLMEMEAIRRLDTAGQVIETGVARIAAHLEGYDRILTLRGYDVGNPFRGVRYDLYELPLQRLRKRLGNVSPEVVTRTGRPKGKGTDDGEGEDVSGGSWKVDVTDVRNRRLCTLVFDRSVEKVTLRSLPVSQCSLLAYWVVQSAVPSDAEETN